MQFDDVRPMTRNAAETALASGDEALVCEALVRCAFHDPDWQWVQEQCLTLIQTASQAVKAVAVVCLGHLARIHGELDLSRVVPALHELAKDPELVGRVQDTLDDIHMFVQPDGRH